MVLWKMSLEPTFSKWRVRVVGKIKTDSLQLYHGGSNWKWMGNAVFWPYCWIWCERNLRMGQIHSPTQLLQYHCTAWCGRGCRSDLINMTVLNLNLRMRFLIPLWFISKMWKLFSFATSWTPWHISSSSVHLYRLPLSTHRPPRCDPPRLISDWWRWRGSALSVLV